MVMVTAPDKDVARGLADAALRDRLVACANIVPGLESHFWWNGKIENASECLILFKTLHKKVKGLREIVRQRHPYEVPEFLVLYLPEGDANYLAWIRSSVDA